MFVLAGKPFYGCKTSSREVQTAGNRRLLNPIHVVFGSAQKKQQLIAWTRSRIIWIQNLNCKVFGYYWRLESEEIVIARRRTVLSLWNIVTNSGCGKWDKFLHCDLLTLSFILSPCRTVSYSRHQVLQVCLFKRAFQWVSDVAVILIWSIVAQVFLFRVNWISFGYG